MKAPKQRVFILYYNPALCLIRDDLCRHHDQNSGKYCTRDTRIVFQFDKRNYTPIFGT